MIKKIAAVHDICGFGRCSLTTAIATLSACGMQCCPVPTAVLSAHTAFKGVTCCDLTSTLSDYINSLFGLSITFDAVYSGYLASSAQIEQVLHLVSSCSTPNSLIIVDPVMGDNGKLYSMVATDTFLPAMKKLCENANIITPNITETAMLLDINPIGFDISVQTAPQYLKALSKLGPETVVITGICENDSIGAAYYRKSHLELGYACAPRVPQSYPGTGDLFTSVLTAAILTGHSLATSVQIACTFISNCAAHTFSNKTLPIEGVLLEPMLPELINLMKL